MPLEEGRWAREKIRRIWEPEKKRLGFLGGGRQKGPRLWAAREGKGSKIRQPRGHGLGGEYRGYQVEDQSAGEADILTETKGKRGGLGGGGKGDLEEKRRLVRLTRKRR